MISSLHHPSASLICLLTFLLTGLNAQVNDQSEKDFYQMKDYFNRSYGPDHNLLNGRQYHLLYSSISHPFYNSDQYRTGSLLMNGVNYEDIPINYDIYKQQVILQYTTYSGQSRQLTLTGERIDRFTLEGKLFRRMSFPETGARFFQVVSSGEISCYLFWEKKMSYSPSSFSTVYNYNKASRTVYYYVSGQLHSINNRSSITKIFDKSHRKEIRRFLHSEQIKFKNASDESLRQLTNFCISLKDEQ